MGFFDGNGTDALSAIRDFLSGGDSDSSGDGSERDTTWSTDEIRDPWAEDEIVETYGPADEPQEEESVAAWASRQTTDSETQTALDCGYEIRNIILCKSIQFNRAQANQEWAEEQLKSTWSKTDAEKNEHLDYAKRIQSYTMPEGLEIDSELGELKILSESEAEFRSDAQRVIYRLLVVETKDKFVEALGTEGAIVIYSGHARYGRGPCFGPTDKPGDDWEIGSDPSTTGIFRMGYPIIGVHVSEIKEHGYSFYPVSTDDFPNGKPPKELLHPEINAAMVKKMKLPDAIRDQAMQHVEGGEPATWPEDVEVYGTSGGEPMVLLKAGWSDTVYAPHELDQADVKCRCFCLFGCSTSLHFQKILRDEKGWTRDGNEGYAFFTSAPSTARLMKFWLESLLNFPEENANQDWDKALNYAKATANKKLAAAGENFKVVS